MSEFWKDRKVLVTGGSGFLGFYVVKRLEAAGALVFSFGSIRYDLRISGHAEKMLEDTYPNIVIHLAGRVGGIGYNRKYPAIAFNDNLMMGMNVIHAAGKENQYLRLVLVSSACAYPKDAPSPLREESLFDGYPEETNAPYGLAKRMMIAQAGFYREERGLDCVCLIPANLYGPGDNFDPEHGHVIPGLIRKFVNAQAASSPWVTLWGSGKPTRDFLYVDDCARGILLAAEKYHGTEPVNLATGKETSIRGVAYAIADFTGYKGEILWDTSKPDGQPRRCLDATRAIVEFGFQAETEPSVGLPATIESFRNASISS